MNNYNVILRPVITEKTAGERANTAKFVFEVMRDANKIMIGGNFKQLFGVTPIKVNVTKVVKKTRPSNNSVKRKATKYAVITVPKGVKVDLTVLK